MNFAQKIAKHVQNVVAGYAEQAAKQMILEKMRKEIGVAKRPNPLEQGNKDIRLVEISNLKQQVGQLLSQGKREHWGLTQYRLAISGLRRKPPAVKNPLSKSTGTKQPENQERHFEITKQDVLRFEQILTQLLKRR
jgi:hypothetical protein